MVSAALHGLSDCEAARFVEICRSGSATARRQLWDTHAPSVRRLLHRLLGPSYDVDDALQETFLQVFRDLATLRDPEALPMFIRSIAVNVARKERRRLRLASLWGLLPARETPPDVAGPARDPQATVAVRRLYELLEALPTKERTVFVLRFVEGLHLEEVAGAAGISLATAKRRLASAAEKVRVRGRADTVLAEYLGGAEEGDEG